MIETTFCHLVSTHLSGWKCKAPGIHSGASTIQHLHVSFRSNNGKQQNTLPWLCRWQTHLHNHITRGLYLIQTLSRYIEQINDRMCQSFLQLNSIKTEIIVFGTKEERLTVSAQLQFVTLKTTKQARNLGVIMDSDLNFSSHIRTH